ncbi:hypothetical protein M758_10G023200 [Ceratodon purpureus]|nr:hypothetical protein M758_10G023200 [Ceratodon purpureus]
MTILHPQCSLRICQRSIMHFSRDCRWHRDRQKLYLSQKCADGSGCETSRYRHTAPQAGLAESAGAPTSSSLEETRIHGGGGASTQPRNVGCTLHSRRWRWRACSADTPRRAAVHSAWIRRFLRQQWTHCTHVYL